MSDEQSSAARERVLQVAERLFSERGYHAVTLRDIATELGMKQASLYNHAPGGKEELYIAVVERSFARHGPNLEQAIAGAGPTLRAQLRAAARWLLAQPPINISRIISSDMPAISPAEAKRLLELLADALFIPLDKATQDAYLRGETRMRNIDSFPGVFVTSIEALHHIAPYTGVPKEVISDDIVDLLLDGLLRH